MPERIKPDLASLASSVRRLLELAKSLGEVVIITNAETGWIELSCGKWYPELLTFVKQFTAISARSMFEPEGVMSPCGWK